MPSITFKKFPNLKQSIAPLKVVRPKVTKAYFAEASIEEIEIKNETKTSQEIYIVKSGDSISKIAKKKGTTVEAIIKSDATITDTNKHSISIGQKITLPNTVASKEKKKKITFKKISSGNLGQELYVIVETKLLQGYLMAINIRQGKQKAIEEEHNNIMLKNDKGDYQEMLKTKVGGMCETDYLNKDDFADHAIFKISIDHNDEKKKEAWIKAIEDATDKKTYLYILTDAHSLSGQKDLNVTYLGDTEDGEIRGEKVTNRWLDVDGSWFELEKGCDCGQEYNGQFKCYKYGQTHGPVYLGGEKLANYKFWNDLVSNNVVTNEEKEILIGMSENEGNLDSVQSYDSEILTAGAMQKTVNSVGKGELTIQVKEFKASNPNKYKQLFEECGWSVEKGVMYYKNPNDSSATKITGKALKAKIREGFTSSKRGKKLECKPLEPIVRAIKDKDFQAKQVEDFINRLKNKVLPLKPSGYSYRIEDFLKSKLGKATALDHHINRPGYVAKDFAKALNYFFTKKDKEVNDYNANKEKKDHKSKISRNPSDWAENHSDFEKEIIEYYGKNRRGTDMKNRFVKMKSKL